MNMFEPVRWAGRWTPGTRRPALCGTDAGYHRHIRTLHNEPCGPCTVAHNDAEKARGLRRRQHATVTGVR